MDINKLQDGVLCQLKIGYWAAKSKMSEEKFGEYLPSEIVNVTQSLLNDRSLNDQLNSVKRKAKRVLTENSMDFPVDGVFWVPKDLIEKLDEEFTDLKTEYRSLTEQLARKIAPLKKEFKRDYPNYYNENKYPTPEMIRAKHYFNWRFFQFGLPEKNSVLSASMYKKERRKFQRMAKEMNDLAVSKIGEVILDRVEKLKEQCDNEKINQGTINSIDRFLEKWDALWSGNVTNAKLKQIMKQVRTSVKGADADRIRSNEHFRNKLSEKMDGIANKIKAIPNHKVKRKLDV